MKKKNVSRRQFFSSLATGAGILVLGKTEWAYALENADKNADPFRIINLGKSGIKTTLLGMGTGYSGGNRSSAITRAGGTVAIDLIRYAYDRGIRFFDCADTYGTHKQTAAALKALPRENYSLGSKIWVGPGGIPESERPEANLVIDRFRKELSTDYIDLVQIHCMTEKNWTTRYAKQLDILDELKSKGIIKAHGVSVHSLDAMETAIESDWVDVIHVRINPYGEAMDHRNPAVVEPLIKKLHDSGKGVIGMKLIGNGSYRNDSGKIDETIKYVFGLKTVDMAIIGFERPEQIDDYAERLKRFLPV
jgi:aryl-alcohol dehydrogenase-like predicted oxidoreductase